MSEVRAETATVSDRSPELIDGAPGSTTPPALTDDGGSIPIFPPRQFDEHGRLIPISDEERRARADAAHRALAALDDLPDDDPPGTEEALRRAIDSHRPPGRKLFEGMY